MLTISVSIVSKKFFKT